MHTNAIEYVTRTIFSDRDDRVRYQTTVYAQGREIARTSAWLVKRHALAHAEELVANSKHGNVRETSRRSS